MYSDVNCDVNNPSQMTFRIHWIFKSISDDASNDNNNKILYRHVLFFSRKTEYQLNNSFCSFIFFFSSRFLFLLIKNMSMTII